MAQERARSIMSKLMAMSMILGTAFPAWASLGGDTASIQADQVHMQGTRTSQGGRRGPMKCMRFKPPPAPW